MTIFEKCFCICIVYIICGLINNDNEINLKISLDYSKIKNPNYNKLRRKNNFIKKLANKRNEQISYDTFDKNLQIANNIIKDNTVEASSNVLVAPFSKAATISNTDQAISNDNDWIYPSKNLMSGGKKHAFANNLIYECLENQNRGSNLRIFERWNQGGKSCKKLFQYIRYGMK